MIKKIVCGLFCFFMLMGLTACQSGEAEVVITPPVVEAIHTAIPTAVPLATPVPPTLAPEVTTAPVNTAVGVTDTPAPTTTPAPTAVPLPVPLTQISLAPILEDGLVKPLFLTHAFDERLFVVEQRGTIQVVENGRLNDTPFLDIQDRVGSNANEQGLFSVAFHPNYAQNGFFFVDYTDNNGDTVIARYQVDANNPNQALANSEVLLLQIPQPYENHNGGQLQFGPDGYLYIGMGDGGSGGDPEGRGQNGLVLLGKILRLDVDNGNHDVAYAIPSTNPFVGQSSFRSEIWAYGLRNPWRFSFDRLTGDLYIADVGQGDWEEVDFQPAGSVGGENYGWNRMEASHCFEARACNQNNLVLPIAEYSHNEGGCSVTGGYVYRGEQFPTLWGHYFFADYCTATIWALTPANDGTWDMQAVYQADGLISSFGEDAHGELYVINQLGGIWQIQP